MDKVKFIYFDIGGVMVEDFSETNKWEEMIMGWGIAKEKVDEVNHKFDMMEDEMCVGRSVNDFLPILEKDYGIIKPENYSLVDDFADRFFRNEELGKIVVECKKHVEIGLLTNMYPGMFQAIKERNLLPELEWDVIIDSSMVKCKKPDEMIYEIAQSESGVKASEILFVDNMERNLIPPKNMGWKTFFYNSADYEASNKELREFLAKIFLI
jgi:FMN phosphatase YigB (HAD superfamily)